METQSSLLKRFPQNLFLTCSRHMRVAGSIQGPPYSSLTLRKDLPLKPSADRNAFGSTAFQDFLHLNPEAFELNHHGVLQLEDDFRVD